MLLVVRLAYDLVMSLKFLLINTNRLVDRLLDSSTGGGLEFLNFSFHSKSIMTFEVVLVMSVL